ncbi:hypothetical protein PG995_004772 [Apiospora arundinis]
MQFTTVAALLSLATTGLAAPAASSGEGVASLDLRAADVLVAERSEGAEVTPEIVEVDGDEDDGDFTDNYDEKSLSGTTAADANAIEKRKFKGGCRHKKVDAKKHLVFKFNKGLPGREALRVQIGGIKGSIARIQYKGQDFNTGTENTQNANCKVGKNDQPWIYKDRFVLNLDCGFSC